jgi:hypothetical protein
VPPRPQVALTRATYATYLTYMMMRSGIGLALVTWVTAAATLSAAWRTPGPGCACAAPAATARTTCCCSLPKAESSCPMAAAGKSCCQHQSPAPSRPGGCGCSTAGSDAPAVPPRPAADGDHLGPHAILALDAPGSALPPAGHPAFGSLAHPAPAPPIDLTLSLSRLTC